MITGIGGGGHYRMTIVWMIDGILNAPPAKSNLAHGWWRVAVLVVVESCSLML